MLLALMVPPMTTTAALPLLPSTPAKSSAVKAGWICLGLGFCTFWIFGFGFLFFSITIVLAVVAMCTHQVKQGVILLLSSLASLALCALIFFAVILGTVGVAAKKVSDDVKRQQTLHQTSRR